LLFVLDIFARKIDTVTSFTKITSISHTKLLKLTVPIPASKLPRFQAAPGQHVYLNIPPESIPSKTSGPSIHNLLYNPFTVADVSTTDITLVLRTLHGPTTTTLEDLRKLSKAKPPLNIEGPYGESRRFPNFAVDFDRVLLVAGGVGATFILPIYHHLASSMPDEGLISSRVELVWSMRSVAEAHWITKDEDTRLFGDEEHVKIYLTGAADILASQREPEDGSIELADINVKEEEVVRVSGGHMRPDLRKIVDETFRYGEEERIAVLVCGPAGMAEELRGHVGRWVAKGRYVWWHNESFGW